MPAPANVCPVDRYNINDLAALLQNPAGKLAKEDVTEVLSRSVNLPNEKLSKEHRPDYTAETSIGAWEADTFIRKQMVSGGIGGETIVRPVAHFQDSFRRYAFFCQLCAHLRADG